MSRITSLCVLLIVCETSPYLYSLQYIYRIRTDHIENPRGKFRKPKPKNNEKRCVDEKTVLKCTSLGEWMD